MFGRPQHRRRAASLALALYAVQLLLAPLAHEAAHAGEIQHSNGCASVYDDHAQLHAPCALPCSDPTHHHQQATDDDHALICNFCAGLSAPLQATATSSSYHDPSVSRLGADNKRSLRHKSGPRLGAPRGPPQVL